MSYMFEVYYGLPTDKFREDRIVAIVKSLDGELTFREGPGEKIESNYICLTFEFQDRTKAEEAFNQIHAIGEHVEGIQNDYPSE
jgi:hypothetical protein